MRKIYKVLDFFNDEDNGREYFCSTPEEAKAIFTSVYLQWGKYVEEEWEETPQDQGSESWEALAEEQWKNCFDNELVRVEVIEPKCARCAELSGCWAGLNGGVLTCSCFSPKAK